MLVSVGLVDVGSQIRTAFSPYHYSIISVFYTH